MRFHPIAGAHRVSRYRMTSGRYTHFEATVNERVTGGAAW